MKAGSRRIKTRRLLPVLILLVTFHCSAQSEVFLRETDPGNYFLDFDLKRNSDILDNIQNGMTSSIKYEIRVYQLGKSFLKRLGRNLLFSKDIVYDGGWDPFLESYLIVQEDGSIFYDDPETFLHDFFSLQDVPIRIDYNSNEEYEVQVQSSLSTIKLLPPLNIMTPFQKLQRGVSSKAILLIPPLGGEEQ